MKTPDDGLVRGGQVTDQPVEEIGLILWFALDGAFLSLYGAGCVVLLYIVMKKTAYTGAVRPVIR